MEKILDFDKFIVKILPDNDSENPRNWDNLGECIFFHKRYNIGDKHNIDADDYAGWSEMKEALIKEFNAVVILPVYMYDHSGKTVSTSPFGDRWDSGQLGFIIATRSKIIENYNCKYITKKIKERVTNNLLGEIETLDQWLKGEVYGFNVIDKETENEIDSCWGFYGDDADNNMFDHLDIGVDKETYTQAYNNASWQDEEVEDYY